MSRIDIHAQRCNYAPMEWSDYKLVLTVAREKSIRGAARHLGVNHATVSRRLAQLNNGPAGPLLHRSPTGFWPTKVGQSVVEAAEKMEQVSDEAVRRQRAAEQSLSGPLSISVPPLILQHLLIGDLARFGEQHPEIELTVDSTDRFVDLDRAEADVVLRGSDSPPDHWVGRRLFPYSLSLYAHKDYLANVNARDLRWIAPPDGDPRWQSWLEESPYPAASISMRITTIAGRFMALKQGLGMGRAACFMADNDPDLVRLPGAPVIEVETFWLLCHPDFAGTSRAKAALAYFSNVMNKYRPLLQGERC